MISHTYPFSQIHLRVLGDNFKGSDIVDAVGRVCQSYTSSTYTQLKQLLQEDELDR